MSNKKSPELWSPHIMAMVAIMAEGYDKYPTDKAWYESERCEPDFAMTRLERLFRHLSPALDSTGGKPPRGASWGAYFGEIPSETDRETLKKAVMSTDDESGSLHLTHASCNLMFVHASMKNEK